ncbi:MAG: hypothetical protein ACREDO_11885 [Methyloceanibacter sp.]
MRAPVAPLWRSAGSAGSAVVAERGGFTVTDVGLGRHSVRDPEGNVLTPQSVTREQAISLLAKLAP